MSRSERAAGSSRQEHALGDEEFFENDPNAARFRDMARRLLDEGWSREDVRKTLTEHGVDDSVLDRIFRTKEHDQPLQQQQQQQQAQANAGGEGGSHQREHEVREAALRLAEIREKGNKGTQFLRDLKKQNFSEEEIAQIDAAAGEPIKKQRKQRSASQPVPQATKNSVASEPSSEVAAPTAPDDVQSTGESNESESVQPTAISSVVSQEGDISSDDLAAVEMGKRVANRIRTILKYRNLGISFEEIIKSQEQIEEAPEVLVKAIKQVKAIEKARAWKAKDKMRAELREAKTTAFNDRKNTTESRVALGQVETRKGAAYQQQDEEIPLGRERIPSVPVDEGPMIQVETRKPGDTPEALGSLESVGTDADVDTSEAVNLLQPDAQADLEALVADVHASVEPPVEMVLPAQAEYESSAPTELTSMETVVAISTDQTAEEQRQLAVDRESDTFRREGWVQSMPVVERTPREWRERLRFLISSVREKIPSGERTEKMGKYLAQRAGALGEKAKEYGPRVEAFIRAKGEEYNRLSFTKKIVVGGVLGVGAAAFSGVSTPLAAAFAVNLGIQRVAGMSSMFLKIEKYLQDHKGSNIGLGPLRIRDEKIKGAAIFGAVAYTALMGAAIGEGVDLASESAYGQAVHEWLGNMLNHQTSSAGVSEKTASAAETAASAPAVPQATAPESAASQPAPEATDAEPAATPPPAEAAPAQEAPAENVSGTKPAEAPAARPAAVAAAGEAAAAGTPEIASIEVKATPGKGYEYMTKRLWEQLQEKNIKLPSGANPDSDLARLLRATPQDIDKVVHDLARDNKFFHNADGRSVLITPDSHIHIDSNGNILIQGSNLTPEGGNLAPSDAAVTPAYHPEAPVYPATEGSGPVQDVLPDMPEEGPAGIAGTTASEITVDQQPSPDILTEQQSPAPVINRDFVVNKFDVAVPLAEPHIYAGPAGSNQVFAFGGEKMVRLNAMFEYLKAHPNSAVIAEDDSGNYRAAWTLVKDRLVQGERLPQSGFFGRLSGAFLPPPGPDELSELIK